MILTQAEREHIHDYLEELDALIEADDGDLFPWPLVEKHAVIKEILNNAIEERDRDGTNDLGSTDSVRAS